MRAKKCCCAVVQAACLSGLAAGAGAENIFSLYSSGPDQQATHSSNMRSIGGTGGVGLSLPDSRPDPLRRADAASYGLRFAHYPERFPNWGVGVDFAHHGSSASVESQAGVWRGALADGSNPLDRVSQRFDQTPGVNVLSVSGIYRWRDEGQSAGRLQPYVGVGLAWYRPTSDGTAPGMARPPLQDGSALGYHMLGGVRYLITERAGAFVEARFNSGSAAHGMTADPDAPARSYHAVAGVSYSF